MYQQSTTKEIFKVNTQNNNCKSLVDGSCAYCLKFLKDIKKNMQWAFDNVHIKKRLIGVDKG